MTSSFGPSSKHWPKAQGLRRINCGVADMIRTRRIALAIATLSLWFGAILGANAQANSPDWPSRPVKFIVPLGPGSGTDIGARLMAEQLTRLWGQPVVVENRFGGDGVIGINAFIAAQ